MRRGDSPRRVYVLATQLHEALESLEQNINSWGDMMPEYDEGLGKAMSNAKDILEEIETIPMATIAEGIFDAEVVHEYDPGGRGDTGGRAGHSELSSGGKAGEGG
jgi:hypothetical protein